MPALYDLDHASYGLGSTSVRRPKWAGRQHATHQRRTEGAVISYVPLYGQTPVLSPEEPEPQLPTLGVSARTR